MANKYCNLDGAQKISEEYPKINLGFDKVEQDLGSIIIGQDLDPNKDIELLSARAGLPTLSDRLNATDDDIIIVNGNLNNKIDVSNNNLNNRIDNIIATPTTVSEQEIIDARQGGASLGANLTSIKNEVAQVDNYFITTKNLFNKSILILDKALTALTGAEGAGVNLTISDYMSILPETQYTIAKGLGSGALGHCFYDVNKVFISGVVSSVTTAQTVSSPVNAHYLRVSTPFSVIHLQQVEFGGIQTDYELYSKTLEIENTPKIEPLKTTFFEVGKNKFDLSKITNGYYVNQTSGVLQANAIHKVTDYIPIKPSTTYKGSQILQRYAFYDGKYTFISGGTDYVGVAITSPSNAKYMRASSDGWNIATLQIEEGTTSSDYEAYKIIIPQEYIESPVIADSGKNYRMVGANIRTPLTVGGSFAIHNDVGHEPMGIESVSISNGDLIVGMSFTARKVVSLNVNPHVSMRLAGYEVATTGGLKNHAVVFFQNGIKVNAEDVVIDGGSFWFNGTFLI